MRLMFSPFCVAVSLSLVGSNGEYLAVALQQIGRTIKISGSEAVIDIPARRVLSLPTFGRLRFFVARGSDQHHLVHVQFVSLRFCYYLLTVPLGLVCLFDLFIGDQRWGAGAALLLLILGGHVLHVVTRLNRLREILDFLQDVASRDVHAVPIVEGDAGHLRADSIRASTLTVPQSHFAILVPRSYTRLFAAVLTCIGGHYSTKENGAVFRLVVLFLSLMLTINAATLRFIVEVVFDLDRLLASGLSVLALGFLGSLILHACLFADPVVRGRVLGECREAVADRTRACVITATYFTATIIGFGVALWVTKGGG